MGRREEIEISCSGKRLRLGVKRTGIFSKGIGLMFKSRETEPLLFDFKKDVSLSIHSLFVFFPFVAVWLNEKNDVLEKKIVRPFLYSVRPMTKFRKFIEIPINKRNVDTVNFFVDKRKSLNTSMLSDF